MVSFRKEVGVGRGFFYVPTPYIALKVTVESNYNREKMLEAIKMLEVTHPVIKSVVEKHDPDMWFVDKGKRVRVYEYGRELVTTWQSVLRELSEKPVILTEESGVIICILEHLDSFELMILCHHLYGDGLTVKQFMDDLLYMYVTGKQIEPKEIVAITGEGDVPIDCRIPEEFKKQLDAVNTAWAGRKVEFSTEEYDTICARHKEMSGYNVVSKSVKGSDYRKLRGKCTETGVTVNAALTTAIAAALQKTDSIRAIVAVNLRPTLDLEVNKGIGNLSSCINNVLHYNNEVDFWENVDAVHEWVKKERTDKESVMRVTHTFMELDANVFGASYFARYGMYRDVEVLIPLKTALSMGPEDVFDVSNLGKVEFEAACEDFNVRSCYFVPNLTISCDCTFGVVSLNNALTITLAHKPNVVSETEAKRILDQVVMYLMQ